MLNRTVLVIHPTTTTLKVTRMAFSRLWPDAILVNLVDEHIHRELDRLGAGHPTLVERVGALLRYAMLVSPDAIVFNGTTFGTAVRSQIAHMPVPVVIPSEVLTDVLIKAGQAERPVQLLSIKARPTAELRDLLETRSAQLGRRLHIVEHHIEGARALLLAGNHAAFQEAVLGAVKAAGPGQIVFAQAPMEEALDGVNVHAGRPLLGLTTCAVESLRRQLSLS